MLDHAREAVALTANETQEGLRGNRVLQLALTRLVEVVGEAASRVSVETQARYPSIPWRIVIGMRHRLIHGYDAVDLNVLWDTTADDLPHLIQALEAVLPP